MAFDPSNFSVPPDIQAGLAQLLPGDSITLIDIPGSGGWAIGEQWMGGNTEGGIDWQLWQYQVVSRDPKITRVGGYYYTGKLIGGSFRGVKVPIQDGGALDGIEMLVLAAIAGGVLYELGTFQSLLSSASNTASTAASDAATTAAQTVSTTATDTTAALEQGLQDAQANLDAWNAQIDSSWSAETQAVTNGQFQQLVGTDNLTNQVMNQATSEVTGSTAPAQVLTPTQATQAAQVASNFAANPVATTGLLDSGAFSTASKLAAATLAALASHQSASGSTVKLPTIPNLPGTSSGDTTRQPDGSITIRQPDGTLMTIHPDGTVTTQAPNQLPPSSSAVALFKSPIVWAGAALAVVALLAH